jgi:hypothetical protein
LEAFLADDLVDGAKFRSHAIEKARTFSGDGEVEGCLRHSRRDAGATYSPIAPSACIFIGTSAGGCPA